MALLHVAAPLALLGYCTSAVIFLFALYQGRAQTQWGYRSFWAGFVGHSIVLLVWLVSTGLIVENRGEAQLYVSWALACIFLIAKPRFRTSLLGSLAAPVVTLFFTSSSLLSHLGGAGVSDPQSLTNSALTALPAGTNMVLLILHVLPVLGAEVALVLVFVINLAFVLQARRLKAKTVDAITLKGPSLERLEQLGLRIGIVGLSLISVGILSGSVWAVTSGRTLLRGDMSQWLGFIAWAILAAVVYLKVERQLSSKRHALTAAVLAGGFICALFLTLFFFERRYSLSHVGMMTSQAVYTEPLQLVGVNHKLLSVSGREKVAALFNGTSDSLRELLELCRLKQGTVLSTCNRFEVVGVAQEDRRSDIEALLSKAAGERGSTLTCYSLMNEEAVRHVFRVAASLDSMVLGEAQILGQVKGAYRAAIEAGVAGPILHRLFQSAFGVAKRVRTHTGLSREGISVSYVAVQLARQIFGTLDEVSTLVLGSGEVAELALLHLKSQGCKRITVANRTVEKALELAVRLGGTAIGLPDIPSALKDADVVIGSLRIDEPLLPVSVVRKLRRTRPLFLIDLGIPRNFAPALGDLDDVYLYNVDDLAGIAAGNRELREEAAKDAELIVEHGVFEFERWLVKASATPAIVDFRAKVASACEDAVRHVLGQQHGISEAQLQQLSRRISQKVGHEFTELLSGSHEGVLSMETLLSLTIADMRRAEESGED